MTRPRGNGREGSRRNGQGWLKFLYEDYEPRCYWFTVVELFRRLWLTALIALLGTVWESTSELGYRWRGAPEICDFHTGWGATRN